MTICLTVRIYTIGQLIFEDVKFQGLSKLTINRILHKYIFEDEQIVSRPRESYNIEDKYFQGSIKICKILYP